MRTKITIAAKKAFNGFFITYSIYNSGNFTTKIFRITA